MRNSVKNKDTKEGVTFLDKDNLCGCKEQAEV
jgi:hypothetical protein